MFKRKAAHVKTKVFYMTTRKIFVIKYMKKVFLRIFYCIYQQVLFLTSENIKIYKLVLNNSRSWNNKIYI